jgi:hypothetical protein
MPIASEEIIHLPVGQEPVLSAFIVGDVVELACVVRQFFDDR